VLATQYEYEMGTEAIPAQVKEFVSDMAAGYPRHIVHLVDALVEQGAVTIKAGDKAMGNFVGVEITNDALEAYRAGSLNTERMALIKKIVTVPPRMIGDVLIRCELSPALDNTAARASRGRHLSSHLVAAISLLCPGLGRVSNCPRARVRRGCCRRAS